jgi:MFS family permease
MLLAAVLVRSVATGLMGPLLGYYLAGLHYDEKTLGAVISAGLGGAALATAAVTLLGHRVTRRTALLVVSALSLAGGAVAALASGPWIVGGAAFVGMLNGMGRDRGACLVLEQAILPETTTAAGRTGAFAWYSVMQDAGVALGSLLSGLPGILRSTMAPDPLLAVRASIGVYLALVAAATLPYLLLSPDRSQAPAGAGLQISAPSRRVLSKIAALFAVDSVAGGFLTAAFLALFFRARFGAEEPTIALLFFARSGLNAVSHVAAAWIARRIGLLNTMVFTHVPSSLFLVTVTFAPSFAAAAVLFLLREALVEMDVPTRTSYVMAVVRPEERTLASGVTHLVRMGGWAVAPAIAGSIAAATHSLAAPLWIGAGLKVAYDVLLYVAFRNVKPPEEGSTH